ncbi:MAG: NADH:ubiquinone oxidoreductase [SAR324 cluster bacterium]|uniref:NADH:ubiquinone oxidoreductase n=1 Tax=SAR324 cluster bacterium TaxID=2024889 RepID=A0A7X9FSD6_9DELT|nr:NADH:ubiquinone oxidoreductase [SAR324 cluster bacterium]
MNQNSVRVVEEVCDHYGNDKSRLMDIAIEVQRKTGSVSEAAIECISKKLQIPRVSVESLSTFYSFLSKSPKGLINIRVCNDIIDKFKGAEAVAKAFSEVLGIKMGQSTPDALFSLDYTPCIGMSDQAPAALINDTVITKLSPDHVKDLVASLKEHKDPSKLVREYGDGNNAHKLVRAMVCNHIRETGIVIFDEMKRGVALSNALQLSPQEVIRAVKTARLRGRGGAGFPTGMKWEFTRAAEGNKKVLICNADEGEPGTFKDRVILTERPSLLFEGMAIGAYAIGADTGILYLRGEYAYLRAYLESVLETHRKEGLLGKNILGKNDFNFDIRIQLGAGAYVCGEETALISSCEGFRGDPKNRPPFPAQKGYLGLPTSVNNVETFCCAARIIEKGAAWFAGIGNEKSSGTKVLSISGDCSRPGIFEVPFGISLKEVLEKAGANSPIAVQVGGPSGILVPPEEFERKICFDDLATGGSIMIFGTGRNLLHVVEAFMEFFVDESCGYCTPCRVGNVLLLRGIREVLENNADASTVQMLETLSNSVKLASRCGLGQTSPNPILSSIKNFPSLYERAKAHGTNGSAPNFDLAKSLAESASLTGRTPTKH